MTKNTETAAPLYHVIMTARGKVAHLENERTGRPMCGRSIGAGRRISLLAVSDVETHKNACRVCVETAKYLSD